MMGTRLNFPVQPVALLSSQAPVMCDTIVNCQLQTQGCVAARQLARLHVAKLLKLTG